ncbi:hypothetical protein RFK95_17650 [Acinetobacter pittii]|uniref:hypothetical protein n=1 Tax=Acinetobacter pittii TaxID=48296 RepID=UPI00280CEF19|nr:hypothetical protein [Acinetobacter pittii]MDQ9034687.1 hypothetical protein [Acinetobacter pittii]MDQ9079650.1 hypothetical protein [Acinetobacter pittii]
MKKLTLLLVLISTGISAKSEVDYKLIQDSCELMEVVATAAQTYRQMDYKPSKTIEELMNTANKSEDSKFRDTVHRLIFDLVEDAYRVQLYSTKSAQDKAISQFANSNYLACINAFKRRIDEKENTLK